MLVRRIDEHGNVIEINGIKIPLVETPKPSKPKKIKEEESADTETETGSDEG